MKGILLIGLAWLASACGLFKSDEAGLAELPLSEAGIAAFQAGTWPWLIETCGACHSTNNPTFATNDVVHSYGIAHLFVNFDDLESSRLLEKAGDNHYGCGGDCEPNVDELLGYLEEWKIGEEAAGTIVGGGPITGDFVTSSLTIPADIPVGPGTQFATMTWSLAGVGAGFGPVIFEIKIKVFSPGYYQIKDPRIRFHTQAVFVQDVEVAVNGISNPQTPTYGFVTTTKVPGDETDLADNSPILVFEDGPGVDKLKVAFGVLEIGQSLCNAPVPFAQNVYPRMVNKCLSCHGKGGMAQGIFDLSGSINDACGAARTMANFVDPANSLLVLKPSGLAPPHPVTSFNGTDQTQFINWINAEGP